MEAVSKDKIVLLLCNNCKGMTDKLLPEIRLRFPEKLQVLPVGCPSQLDAFAVIKLLKCCAEGVIIACPQNACCCPSNKTFIRRWELMKDMLPVCGFNKEQFQLAAVSPFEGTKLTTIIEQMIAFLDFSKTTANEYEFLNGNDKFGQSFRWLN